MSSDRFEATGVDQRLAGLSPERQRLVRSLLQQEGLEPARLPIHRIPRTGGHYALSFAQERLWFLEQLTPGSPAYHVHVAVPVGGLIVVPALEASLNAIVERHEILRSRVVGVLGEPRLEIVPDLRLALEVTSLAGLPADARSAEIGRLATVEAQRPFDLARGPLLRARLLQLAPHEAVLLLTMHHLVSDGWSMNVFNRELEAWYRGVLTGRPPALEPLPIQYVDFAAWQRSSMPDSALPSQLDYWTARLDGAPRVLDLPADRPRPAQLSLQGARRRRVVPADLAEALRAMSQREGVTLFMLLLSAFAVLLYRYTEREDLVIGTPIANRTRPEVAGLIGFFVNTLLLRLDLSGGPSFRALTQRVRRVALEAYEHQDLPFEQLIQKLNPERDLSRTPFFQVSFQLFASGKPADATRPLSPDGPEVDKGTANVDLALDMDDGPLGLTASVEYSTDLFHPERIERLLDHFQMLLGSIVANPDMTITRLPMLTPGELDDLRRWNDTSAVLSGPELLHELVLERLREDPARPAIIEGDVTLTAGELSERAGKIAAALAGAVLKPEELVGIAVDSTVDVVAAVLGVLRAGGAYLPIDLGWPSRRVESVLRDAGCTRVITREHLRPALPESVAAVIDLDALDRTPAAQIVGSLVPRPVSPSSLAYVIYTSGSTGQPRGVMVEHRSAANHVKWILRDLALTTQDRVLQQYSPCFDASIAEIFPALAAGATLVAATPAERHDLAALARLIVDQRVTTIDLVPSALDVLLDVPAFASASSVRRVVCGGEALTGRLRARVHAATDAELVNMYGPTEGTIAAAWWRTRVEAGRANAPIGLPIANLQMHIVDGALNPMPVGVPGQIAIGGVGVARGYRGLPDATTSRFVPDPFSSEEGARLFLTGDAGVRRADGVVEFAGRLDDQLKIRGFRIEPSEVEAILAQHGSIERVVIAARGTNQEWLDNVDLSDEALAGALERLPEEVALSLLAQIRGATDAERTRRETTPAAVVARRRDESFQLELRSDGRLFAGRPEAQRVWLIERTLDETADDLRHLNRLADGFVRGSARRPITATWTDSPISATDEELLIDGQQVMQSWERPLMQALADIAAAAHGDVLEVGFGLGISAAMLQDAGVRSHTIVESNAAVLARAHAWKASHRDSDIRLVGGSWQETVAGLGPFDAILFDTYPQSETEFQRSIVNSCNFAEEFFPIAARLLRPGGVFTYYTNEIDSFSRRHQRALLAHFASLTLSVVSGLRPPADCQYWWADSMVVVRAEKKP